MEIDDSLSLVLMLLFVTSAWFLGFLLHDARSSDSSDSSALLSLSAVSFSSGFYMFLSVFRFPGMLLLILHKPCFSPYRQRIVSRE